MSKLLLLLDSLLASFDLGQTAADGTSLLGTEVQGSELLGLVEQTELFALGLVDDSQNASNSLASGTNLLESSSTGDLLNTEGCKILLEFIKLLGKLGLVFVAKLVGFDGNLN